MDRIHYPYRSSSHLALMHVIQESGAWERHGLDVEYQRQISRSEAHELVPKGEVEFVSGNHVSTYAARARGDTWEYLGQTVSHNIIKLVTRADTGIEKLEDVRLRKFATRGGHPSLNTWLYLKQSGLDPDKDQVDMVTEAYEDGAERNAKSRKGLLEMVRDGDADACFMNQPRLEFARRAGLRVIDIAAQPMVSFMTVSTSKKMVDEHPDICVRNIKAILEGIAFFKQNREATIAILTSKHQGEGKLNRTAAERVYDDIAPALEPRLYPSLAAINNVYQEALKQDGKNGDAARIHPLALWNFHFLREIDDSGFIANLYKDHPEMLNEHGG